jgi:hypothetical protein
MTKNIFAFSTVVVVVVLLLIAATGATTILTTVHAQILGEPFFKETGKITGQKDISPNKMQVSFSANGTLKDVINVTNTGDFVSISRGDNLTFAQGQGIFTKADGMETARYNFIGVGNVTQEGKTAFVGAVAYHTNSTGDLAFMNNILGIFKVELDKTGSFTGIEWQWK